MSTFLQAVLGIKIDEIGICLEDYMEKELILIASRDKDVE